MSQKKGQMVFKVVVVGDSGSGKSCLFLDNYQVTLGVEYLSKTVKMDNNLKIKLQFWDTAGQQAFNSIVKSFYRNTHAVVLVYDITRKQTFDNLDQWQMDALENAPQDIVMILIGTHLDKGQERQVSYEQAKNWMKEANIQIFFQTSAKTAENVQKAFEQLCSQLLFNALNKNKESHQNIKLKIQKDTQNSCC